MKTAVPPVRRKTSVGRLLLHLFFCPMKSFWKRRSPQAHDAVRLILVGTIVLAAVAVRLTSAVYDNIHYLLPVGFFVNPRLRAAQHAHLRNTLAFVPPCEPIFSYEQNQEEMMTSPGVVTVALLLVLLCLVVSLVAVSRQTACTSTDPLIAMWSKGPHPHTAYNRLATEHKCGHTAMIEHITRSSLRGYVWIRSSSSVAASDIPTFAEHIDTLKHSVALITSDGDMSIPSELPAEIVQRICDSPLVSVWYTQNYDDDGSHPKIRPYPIGLDLHTRRDSMKTPEQILQAMMEVRARHSGEKLRRIFCDVSVRSHDRFGGQRKLVASILKDVEHADMITKRVPRKKVWQLYAQHEFVVSPPGNGLDCHRTWEVLALGSIPIVMTSRFDELFTQLPVIVVSDWRELATADLMEWLEQVKEKRSFVHENMIKTMYPFFCRHDALYPMAGSRQPAC